jgi:hypothetical protein
VGSGWGDRAGRSSVGNLAIFSSIVNALASNGSGIGTGTTASSGISNVGTVTLTGVIINARSLMNGTGIGGGWPDGQLDILILSGTSVMNSNSKSVNLSVNATSIVIADASLVFETEGTRLFGSSPSSTSLIDLTIFYHRVTLANDEPLSELQTSFLQIGNLNISENNDEKWTFCVSNGVDERCIAAPSADVTSVVLSIPTFSNYSIQAFTDERRGHLESDGNPVFEVNSNISFFDTALFVPVRSMALTKTPTETSFFSQSPFLSFTHQRLIMLFFFIVRV